MTAAPNLKCIMVNEGKNTEFPLIGITLDSEEASVSGYSKFPWYALRENYASVVVKAGGIPVILPHALSILKAREPCW